MQTNRRRRAGPAGSQSRQDPEAAIGLSAPPLTARRRPGRRHAGRCQRPSRPGSHRRTRLDAPRRNAVPRPDRPSVLQLSLGALRMVLPLMQKMLPLLEGNVASAVSNLLAPVSAGTPAGSRASRERSGQAARGASTAQRTAEQNALLKRVSDQVDLVKEAADRTRSDSRRCVRTCTACARK